MQSVGRGAGATVSLCQSGPFVSFQHSGGGRRAGARPQVRHGDFQLRRGCARRRLRSFRSLVGQPAAVLAGRQREGGRPGGSDKAGGIRHKVCAARRTQFP